MRLSDASFDGGVLLAEQASNPATPASGYGRLYPKSDGLYFIDDAGVVTGPLGTGGGGGGASADLVHVREEQTSGTAGGGFTSGAWQTRILNTTKTNTVAGASLASNAVTLPAGTYDLEARAPACRVGRHQARLYNVTASAVVMLGGMVYSAPGSYYAQNDATVLGRFTLASSADVRLEHRCESSVASDGYGLPTSWGTEVFAELLLRKVA